MVPKWNVVPGHRFEIDTDSQQQYTEYKRALTILTGNHGGQISDKKRGKNASPDPHKKHRQTGLECSFFDVSCEHELGLLFGVPLKRHRQDVVAPKPYYRPGNKTDDHTQNDPYHYYLLFYFYLGE